MAVLQSTVSRVKPGRYEDVLSLSLEAVKIHERLGVPVPRITTATVAGEASGLCVFSTEHDDVDAYGRFAEATAADPELQTLVTRAQAADAPSVVEQTSLAFEVPLDRTPKPGRGSLIEIHVSRSTPGQLEETIAISRRLCDFVEGHGAKNARLFQIAYGGMGSGLYMASWEFDDVGGWVRLSKTWQTEPEGLAIAASSTGPTPHSTLVFSGLYTEIPL
ncbi:MAG TPA: hypothetical protein DCQ30_03355 [Acidimicrobiaceae bacterium]|nr:hypothetical protein [Acidimicrobiaceae bacterium]